MPDAARSRLPEIIARHEQSLLDDWVKRQSEVGGRRGDAATIQERKTQSAALLNGIRRAVSGGDMDIGGPAWQEVKQLLADLSVAGVRQGFSASEIATFVFSLKHPLFARLRQELASDAQALADETWRATTLLDALGLYTTESFQKGREQVIGRQQQELLELSTPVVRLWENVLALPLIGTLDSARTQVVMESLLQQIVDTGAAVAIIDITGVPTVDTLVAQHLLKTVAAARLMGAECIISGIRPQIAQTIVHLGVDLGDVITKGSLADALKIALQRTGFVVTRAPGPVSAD